LLSCNCKKNKFTYLHITDVPDGVKGIYGIWHNKTCIYIGKAKEQIIKVRLTQEWNRSHNKNLRAWIESMETNLTFCWISAETQTINSLETRLIDILQPVTNVQGKD